MHEGSTAAAPQTTKAMRIVTHCATMETFLSVFSRFVDESSIYIVTDAPRPVGLRQPFVLELRGGGGSIMRGEAEVVESFTGGDGPRNHNGMRLRLLAMNERSRGVHRQLLARAEADRAVAAAKDRPPSLAPAAAGAELVTDLPPPSTNLPPPARSVAPPAAPEETRAPGSALRLPANPFEALSPADLEAFVECTLYEERGSIMDEPTGDPTATSPRQDFAASPSPEHAPPLTVRPAAEAARRRPAWMARAPALAVTAVVSAAASLGIAFLIWGRGTAPTRDTSATEASSARAAVVAAPSSTSTAATADTSAAAPRPDPVPARPSDAPASKGGCLANIRSDPSGAQVFWKGEALGNTPLANVNVPCGTGAVAFQLEGYVPVERSATAFFGRAIPLVVRMNRPRAVLQITSTPPGALAIVNGIKVGKSPASVMVDAHREASVVLARAGYRVWTSKVTPAGSTAAVHGALVPLAKGAAPQP